MIREFIKMHSLRNDFIILHKDDFIDMRAEHVNRLCDRRTGIGCDQLIVYSIAHRYKSLMRVQVLFFNSDASEAHMCGNGLRSLAFLLYKLYQIPQFLMQTKCGEYKVVVHDNDMVSINMQKCTSMAYDFSQLSLLQYGVQEQFLMHVGNRHVVSFLSAENDFADKEHLHSIHRIVMEHFLHSVNSCIVQIKDDGLYVHVFERGAGYTYSCGSGASAAFAAAWLTKIYKRQKDSVYQEGGALKMQRLDGGEIIATGRCEIVCSGQYLADI